MPRRSWVGDGLGKELSGGGKRMAKLLRQVQALSVQGTKRRPVELGQSGQREARSELRSKSTQGLGHVGPHVLFRNQWFYSIPEVSMHREVVIRITV